LRILDISGLPARKLQGWPERYNLAQDFGEESLLTA
jgi:hypothetical protein